MGIINLAIQLLSGDDTNNQVIIIKQILSFIIPTAEIQQLFSEKIKLCFYFPQISVIVSLYTKFLWQFLLLYLYHMCLCSLTITAKTVI